MKTIKLDILNAFDILKDMKTFNSIVHISYNRFREGFSEKEVRAKINPLFKGENSWFIQCAIKEGKATHKKFKDRKIVFGGKYNLNQYLTKKISKKQFLYNRLAPISVQGEKSQQGNRLFKFNLNENELVFKKNKKDHRLIKFKKLKKNLRNELQKIQELCDKKKLTLSVRFNDKHVWLTYDEALVSKEKYKDLKENRVLGIDMNPNYIGMSIIEFDKKNCFNVLYKQVFDVSELTKKSGKSSDNKLSKYKTNKLKYETIQIVYEISKLVNTWKCKIVSIEDLCINPSNKGKGKHFNRLCNNIWERRLFVIKLNMLANINGFNLVKVNPAYSSIIGNIAYGNENTPDMIAASIEIGRRAYKKYEKGWFCPEFKVQYLNEQWKQTLGIVEDWKDLFLKIKKSGLKYRFLLQDYVKNAVYRKNYIKRLWKIYSFN